MQARIHLNLGMMKEHKSSDYLDAIKNYERAIKICKSNDLFELQHSSLMASGYFYAFKQNDFMSAMQMYNNAQEVAKRLVESKNEKMCETLLAKGTLLIKNGDFQSARLALKRAYKMKTAITSDKEAIEKNFKIVALLCKYEDELVTVDSFDYGKRKELFEKLGDASCKVKNFEKAIDYYQKTLESAELNGNVGKSLIPIYVSLYQTHIDMKNYEEALKYLQIEYDLVKDENPKEACNTLMSIANLLSSAKKDFWEIERAFRKALTEARFINDTTIERAIIKKLVIICKEYRMPSLADLLIQEAKEKQIDLESNCEDDSDDVELSEDIDINDAIINDSDLSTDADSSDGNETIHIQKNSTASDRSGIGVGVGGRKKRSLAVKKNAKGLWKKFKS